MLKNDNNKVLVVGHTGVGKTALIENILLGLESSIASFNINLSSQTSAVQVQEIIEEQFERWSKNKWKPKNAKKKLICFIDDLNMPRKDKYGS